jgi:hypothetical protein
MKATGRPNTPSFRRDSNHEATAGWSGADDFYLIANNHSMRGDEADRAMRKSIGSSVRRKEYLLDALDQSKNDAKYRAITPIIKRMIHYYRFQKEMSVISIADLLKTEPHFIVAAIAELLAIQGTKR